MIYNYDFCEYLMVVNGDVTKDIFLDRCGVKYGYSRDLFSRIYDSILTEAIDIIEQFERYYFMEYPTLREFIYHRYTIDWEGVDEMIGIKEENPRNTIIEFDGLSYGHNSIGSFITSDIMYDRIVNVFLNK